MKNKNIFGMKVPSKKPMSTRNIVKRHLKEWNKDDEEIKPMKGGGFKINISHDKFCPKCGKEILPGEECCD